MATMASYSRAGGRPPVDDERLVISPDGTWRLWRTLGGSRVGAFEGRLSADRRQRLEAALAVVAAGRGRSSGGGTPRRPVPDSAHERFAASSRALDVPAGSPVSGEWSRLASLLRRWSASLTAEPERALELSIPGGDGPGRPGASAAALRRLGPGTLRVWPATLHLDLYARDADGIVVERASAGGGAMGGGARGEPITTGPGWSLELAGPRTVSPPPGGSLEVWAWLDIDGPDHPVRSRLVAARKG